MSNRNAKELDLPTPLHQFDANCGRFWYVSDLLHDFSVTILRCYKYVYANSSFPCTARLWNYLPIESFLLTYPLNGFKSQINRLLLTAGSFWTNFLYALNFLCFIFLQLHALQWLFSLAWSESQKKNRLSLFSICICI